MLNAPFHSGGRRLTGLGLVALLGSAGAVASWVAPTSSFDSAANSPIAAPHWVRRPVPADIARFYPAQALAARLPGRALIDCRVSEQGALTHCAILSEGPAGAGFGQAALAMTQAFQMSPAAENGRPVAGGRVRIPIRFMPAST
jgi:TonB family protein